MHALRSGLWVVGAIALLAAGSAAAMEPVRLVAEVPEDFVVDGREFAAGPLVIRQRGGFTPTRTLDTIGAGRETIGLFLARVTAAERPAVDVAFFRRNGAGRLFLVGYALATTTGGAAYRYPFGPADTRIAGTEIALPLVVVR